jgi:hypothetical protein
MPWPPSLTPKWSFPPSVCRMLDSQGNEALVLVSLFCEHQRPMGSHFCKLNFYMNVFFLEIPCVSLFP